jgi:hypothetical protein
VPTNTQLLATWEQGLRASATRRAVLLAALAAPEHDAEVLERYSIGQRDALLLQLRAQLFGAQLTCVAPCQACAERVELDFQIEEITVLPPGDPGVALELRHADYCVLMRPPQIADLLQVESEPFSARRAALLARCVLTAQCAGQPLAASAFPETLIGLIAAQLAAADPQADVQLELACPACGHSWSAIFDIASFLWHELDAWARRILREIHTLALAYGWSEAAILALGPERRATYLEMVRG